MKEDDDRVELKEEIGGGGEGREEGYRGRRQSVVVVGKEE